MTTIRTDAYLRADGRKGIRDTVAVVYLVECAHHVAREIQFPFRDAGVHLLGFGGCYPNDYSFRMLSALCTHPNVGGVLLVSLGCEGFNRGGLLDVVRRSGRPADLLVIQESGGTRATIDEGQARVREILEALETTPRAPLALDELVVGTICGGSDGTSGITANPAIGLAFDTLVVAGATCIFEETGELIGCEQILATRGATPPVARQLVDSVEKAARYYATLGHGSFAPGNADGGLTTQEEKSMGAFSKSGSAPITGLIKPGDLPPAGGLYLLDVVPDGEVRFGFPNVNDTAEIVELIACGSHVTLFSTGRGSVVGSAISPVIKVCANPETFRRLAGDMDIDAGRVLEGHGTLPEVATEIVALVERVAAGAPTASESLGHQEFVLGYKAFEPVGPVCHPASS
jgi:altronate dehydratase large subunit